MVGIDVVKKCYALHIRKTSERIKPGALFTGNTAKQPAPRCYAPHALPLSHATPRRRKCVYACGRLHLAAIGSRSVRRRVDHTMHSRDPPVPSASNFGVLQRTRRCSCTLRWNADAIRRCAAITRIVRSRNCPAGRRSLRRVAIAIARAIAIAIALAIALAERTCR